MSFSKWLTALACIVLMAADGLTVNTRLSATTRTAGALPTEQVSIAADVNGRFVTVRADGSLAPVSATVSRAEQFDLYDLGGGLIALRSLVNGLFVSALDDRPLTARSTVLGQSEMFRTVGRERGAVRLRNVAAKGVVCAADGGGSVMMSVKRCPHSWQLLRVELVPSANAFEITSPQPGSVLTTTAVTFRWDQGGDEFWLKIGTTPGASDVYASGSLGTATEHQVTRLPLNGETVFVQVSRRVGTAVDSVTAQYTAPVRKGLAIITDFADRRLEDWTGGGFRSVDDVSAQLRAMEQHWAWLSRGVEAFEWEILRVQLPQRAVADAYPDWMAFREAVITLARQQLPTGAYDVNSDGVIDAAWLIVSSGLQPVPFAIGGTSQAAGANVFVDGQASGSVQAGATGNFNHELGHCLGLPDMYGPFTTLNKLTVMADSWALPAQDFSAYERLRLGWLELQTISQTTSGVWLPSADQYLAAIKVPTVRPTEYFLIEYRNPPASGYGSATQGYRGLAVYHVLEGSSMWEDPPIVRLEPADGGNVPNQELDPYDFVYPENPALLRPLTLRSYYDDRDDVFTISNIAWREEGMVFDLAIAPQPPLTPAANMLVNPSFESGASGVPDAWTPSAYVSQGTTFAWPSPVASEGQFSAYLETSGNDMRWTQSVTTIPGEHYLLCGALKGEDVRGLQGDVGGNVSVVGGFVRSPGLSGTFDWTKACVAFVAEAPQAEVACRLGFYGSTASGKLWCDAFTLEHVRLQRVFTQ